MESHIFSMLARYAESDAQRYHMPGHKGRGDGILSDVYKYDITELPFSDNLANPSGVILRAENDIASIIGAKRCRILTGGSTLGVLTCIYAAKSYYKGERNRLIISKSSHKSVYNALAILNLEPVFLPERIVDGLPQLDTEKLDELCDNCVIGALVTYPDYFGRCIDVAYISKVLKQHGCLFLLDGAHGSHFAFTNKDCYAGRFADLWVDGAHKTLNTLTSGALLGIGNENLCGFVEDGLSILSTSSPNYLIMGSVEDGYKSFLKIDSGTFQTCKRARERFCDLLDDRFCVVHSDDFLKLCIDLRGNADGEELGEYLSQKGIFVELASGRFLLFMLSVDFDLQKAVELAKAINDYPLKKVNNISFADGKRVRAISYSKAKNSEYEWVKLSNACGRISAGEVGLFPPCYPLIVAGELFDNEVIGQLLCKNTFGIEEGMVKVVKV